LGPSSVGKLKAKGNKEKAAISLSLIEDKISER